MKIVVDAMGGDRGPEVVVEGVVDAFKEIEGEIILVGEKSIIQKCLARFNFPKIKVIDAPETIDMDDDPMQAVRRKKNSSLVKAMLLLKEGEVDALVSAGNTGAVVTAASIYLKRIQGVHRPTLAVPIPTPVGYSLLLDVGACVDTRAEEIYQFAVMGSLYAQRLMGIENPKVALLNIGEEKMKGNKVVREAYALLEKSSLNFIGNVEGRDLFWGKADVVVCDGFVGNIVLKSSESIAESLSHYLREKIEKSDNQQVKQFLRKALKDFFKRFDYSNYGGALLLGVKGYCVVTHGASPPEGIKNSVLVASREVISGINEEIEKFFSH
ncbi:phosphate acyltransferase PlsX [Candidatus Calescamantes bacterium]|nr:phosphate acyltransferase PlsX [Candidatus Calescamantes bacterium]